MTSRTVEKPDIIVDIHVRFDLRHATETYQLVLPYICKCVIITISWSHIMDLWTDLQTSIV